jgi:hypothetical protein
LNAGWVKELLSLHQGPGDHQHLGGDLNPHLRADAFLALAAIQKPAEVITEMAGGTGGYQRRLGTARGRLRTENGDSHVFTLYGLNK